MNEYIRLLESHVHFIIIKNTEYTMMMIFIPSHEMPQMNGF